MVVPDACLRLTDALVCPVCKWCNTRLPFQANACESTTYTRSSKDVAGVFLTADKTCSLLFLFTTQQSKCF